MRETNHVQFGLFEGERVKAKDESAARRERWEIMLKGLAHKPDTLSTRVAIVRGFVGLHFKLDPETIMNRSLLCLGGRTLTELATHNWDEAHAYMLEVKLHTEDREFYLEEYNRV